MRTLSTIYLFGFFCIYAYQRGEGNPAPGAYTWAVFFVSLLLACLPFAMSKFWFGLPLLILAWCFFMPNFLVPKNLEIYDANFAWLCIIFAPFHWCSIVRVVLGGIKFLIEE